ncbi:MAG: lytic murein transglycosylase [Alphaproteobacteria bacterium]|nr:lytic murein transglycosylase [Alphaproteobacteria bacterium]
MIARRFFLCSFLLFISGVVHAESDEFDASRWNAMLHRIQDRAVAERISPVVINDVIQNSVFVPDIVNRDRNQPEFKLTIEDYLRRTVTETRISQGKATRKKYPTLLSRVDKKYGVPPHIILAFWGMESNYGTFRSTNKLSDAFLTLIYDGRREKFFTDQLFALMKIADKNKLSIQSLRGSWAGAMGHFQFIPTTLVQYGVDGNGDGKIDIMNSVSDAMYSAGNYLNKLGWNKNERILRTVSIPGNFNASLADSKSKKTLDEWGTMGVRNPDGTPIPKGSRMAGIVFDVPDTPSADRITAYLVYDNFYRIKRWNNSNSYAVAIALLADRLK